MSTITKVLGVCLMLAIQTACLGDNAQLAGLFDPQLKISVDDPIEGARVEGSVVPVSVRVHNSHHDVVFTATVGEQTWPVATWPDEDFAMVDLALPPGSYRVTFTAIEQGDDDGNRVDETRDIVLVPQGTGGTDYPIGMFP